ncbi:MAG: alkaline phosphatase PhoX, partial [Bacteroidota bacterium]
MQTHSRRHFLRTAAALSLGFTGLHTFAGCAVTRQTRPLVSDPNGLLDLPAGFRYTAFSRVGERMDDGFLVPHRHDGMAAFPGPDGLTVLVRNHEVNADAPATEGAFHGDPSRIAALSEAHVYDRGRQGQPALGGTSTLVYDTRSQQLVSSHLSLAGTIRNCAGGPTPWNTWITCEETTERAGAQWQHDHGYNFEVPASAQPGLVEAVPLRAMGRFNHEAVAVHPATSIVYQTEDRNDGLIYRFIPNTPERLHDGGRLQALVVRDAPSLDTRNW